MDGQNFDNVFGVENVEPNNGQFEDAATENTEEQQEENSTPDNGQVEGKTEETTETKEEPTLILGKFKSQEDLEKAYRNLEANYTRLSQQTKVAPKQEQPQKQEVSQDEQFMAWYEQAVMINPVEANKQMAQYIAQKEIVNYQSQFESKFEPFIKERQTQQLINQTANKYNDFYNYTNAIVQEIEQIAIENPQTLDHPSLYEIAYHRAKNKAMEEQMKSAFENGKKSALESLKQKKQITNEVSKANQDDNAIPEGITIIPQGDGIFI